MVIEFIKKYLYEVISEGEQVVFPTKADVYFTCLYIALIVFVVVFGVSIVDYIISYVIKILFVVVS